MFNFNDVEIVEGNILVPTRIRVSPLSFKRIDRALDTLDVSLGEIKEILPIDKIPEPTFLKFDAKVFIPRNILEKARSEITEMVSEIKWFNPPIEKIKEIIEKMEPEEKDKKLEEKEISSWMHEATAEFVTLRFIQENYNQSNNSYMVTSVGDAYTPGVSCEDLSFAHETGYTVTQQGFANLITPYGKIEVPDNDGSTIIKEKLLAYAHIKSGWGVQTTGHIMKWKSLATTLEGKVKNLVCKNFGGKEDPINPQFFAQVTKNAVKLIKSKITMWSSKDQKVLIEYRDPTNYENVVFKDWIDVPAGKSELNGICGAYPHVPPLVAHIKPKKDAFALQSYDIVEVK